MAATALIIDDEADIRELIAITLTRMGWDFHAAANLEEARNLLGLHAFDLCLTDMRLPDGNGVDFVKYAQKSKPHVPIAVITAHGNMEAAVDAMKNGAYDFVSKPVEISQLRQLVTQAIELKSALNHSANDEHIARSTSSNSSTKQKTSNQHTQPISLQPKNERNFDSHTGTQLIGNSKSIQELHGLIDKVARTNAPIWIMGESGTGKELIARLIHERGPRKKEPFVAFNCGAIPANLIESELFGQKKNHITGTALDQIGLFSQAHGGTLFLDEVSELPLQMQVKLLRAIQERSFRPVGGREEESVNVRILSASQKDLASEVEAGKFRHDLYYRLNVISLHAPNLRDRLNDIDLLVDHLLKKLEQTHGVDSINIDSEALSLLNEYHYPGNVRELENILERASTLMDFGVIKACDINLPNDKHLPNQKKVTGSISIQVPNTEYQRIVDALDKTHWNRKAAAELLGLTYRQLRYRIKQLKIDKS